MRIKPLHPTKEEVERIFTPEGMRERIQEYALYNNLTNSVLKQARSMELNTEDTMTMLAFHALSAAEDSQDQLLRYLQTAPPPMLVNRGN